ncbi:histone H2A-beta, sperm-like [Octodon degus]|uniref:Histone H2A n=1 Tax=Octodon degus TaxID=10160 RepID=A0A6P3FFY1_OCTDE|nr:histone H2A-beta, sperm-like [Octodon degus]
MAGKKRGRKPSKPMKKAISRSSRAELQFPVSRVERYLREGGYAQRLSSTTPVFLAGVLEFLTANILDQAGKEAQDKRKKRIAPQHLETVIESIQQLHSLLGDGTKSLLDEMVHAKDK